MKNNEIRFLTMEYYFLILNRTYEITINQNGIHGAIVNQIMSAVNPNILATRSSGNAYDLISSVNVEKTRGSIAGSKEFLELSGSNFSYTKNSILSILYDSKNKWGMGPVPHSGKLYITSTQNTVREFIILGRPNIEELLNKIESIGFHATDTKEEIIAGKMVVAKGKGCN